MELKMELVKVNLYAYAYYSGVEYEENIWIKKSSYEKIKECFPTEVYIADIDGKYSETEGKVTVKESFKSDKEYAIEGKLECDGESLKWELESVYENNNLDYEFEQEEIAEFLNSIDVYEKVTVKIPRSKVTELKTYAEKLCGD